MNKLKYLPKKNVFKSSFSLPAVALITLLIAGCDSSDEQSSGTGYLIVYNASSNSPDIEMTVELDGDSMYSDKFGYSEVSGTFSMDNDSYDIEMSIPVSSSLDETIYQGEQEITVDDINLVAVTGSIDAPEVVNYRFALDELDSEDDLFTIRLLNLYQSNDNLNVYLSLSNESFDDAVLVNSVGFGNLSDSTYYETDSYKIYITDSNEQLLFESDDVAFSYTNQQILVIKQNPSSNSQGYMIDRITSSGSVTHIADKGTDAQLRVFNAMDENSLLSSYNERFDLHLGGMSDTPFVADLQRHQASALQTIDAGDYSMDISDPVSNVKLANSQILSLPDNSNKTIFYYLTEVTEEDDDDEDTVEETELYVNSVITENASVEGLYHHEIQILNFVEDHEFLTLYFVPLGESISTTPYKVINARALASTIKLPNDDYNVFILATEDSSSILLKQSQLILNTESKNGYFVIEQQDAGIDEFIITRFDQN